MWYNNNIIIIRCMKSYNTKGATMPTCTILAHMQVKISLARQPLLRQRERKGLVKRVALPCLRGI